MKFASTRLVAADIKSMVAFYELVTGRQADWLAPVFAEIVKAGSAEAAANRTAILEFMVDDVEAEYARLKDHVELVHEPKTMPWGNRTTMLRDPEGTLVALYTPVTDAAKARFAGR